VDGSRGGDSGVEETQMSKTIQTMQYVRKPYDRAQFINSLHMMSNEELVNELAFELIILSQAATGNNKFKHVRFDIDNKVHNAIFDEIRQRLCG
jgi:hypothetical protein